MIKVIINFGIINMEHMFIININIEVGMQNKAEGHSLILVLLGACF